MICFCFISTTCSSKGRSKSFKTDVISIINCDFMTKDYLDRSGVELCYIKIDEGFYIKKWTMMTSSHF